MFQLQHDILHHKMILHVVFWSRFTKGCMKENAVKETHRFVFCYTSLVDGSKTIIDGGINKVNHH